MAVTREGLSRLRELRPMTKRRATFLGDSDHLIRRTSMGKGMARVQAPSKTTTLRALRLLELREIKRGESMTNLQQISRI